jgi:hypothetical protein
MLENIRLLAFSYLILSYLGIGIFALITPDSFKKPYLYALVSPGFGLILLVIIGSWVMAINTAITWTMIISLLMATGLNLFVLGRVIIRRKISLKRFIHVTNTLLKTLLAGVLLLGILFLIILPGVREGNFTTPLRIGPDSIGYAGAAQTLVEGGTLTSIAEDLKAVTGEEDLEAAKQANFQLLRLDLHCSSEFLLKALRWGYPTILANMTWVTGLDSVYRLDFVLLVFSWTMLLGLAYYACRIIIKARWYICLLLTAALALNCNLLNIFYEGSYAEVMAIPVLFMLLLYLYNIREINTFENKRDRIKQVAFVGFLCAGLLSIWTEAFIVLGIICFIILVLDLLQVHKTQKAWLSVFCFGVLFAFILVAPLTWSLILFYKNYLFIHLANMSQGGWWQPQWATLPEIMGWTNIYAHGSQAALVQRNTIEIIIAFLGSIFIVAAAVPYLFSNNRLRRSFWLASIVFIVFIFLKTGFLDKNNNYQYYKAYTMFLPVIFLFVYAAIFYLTKKINSRWKYALYGIVALSLGITAYSGFSYVKKYYQESSYFTEEFFLFKNQSELLSNYVLMTPYGLNYFHTTQMSSVFKMNFYNFPFEVGYQKPLIKTPYLEMPVAIIIFYNDQKKTTINSDDVIYSGKEFQIVKTPYRLKDRLDENGNVDINNYFNFGSNASIETSSHFDSFIFTDETGKDISSSGNAHIDTGEKKFGTASGSFDGQGDYLTVPNSPDFDFGYADFTIDGWFYFNANDVGYQCILDRRGTNPETGWIFYLEGNNQLSFLSTSKTGIGWDNAVLHNTSVVPATGVWMHLAVVRNGDVFTMYQNGIAIKSGTFSGSIGTQTVSPSIGAGHASRGNYFNGYMDELRISKGIARWTENFTPPDEPYTASDEYTVLLLHFDTATKDSGATILPSDSTNDNEQ